MTVEELQMFLHDVHRPNAEVLVQVGGDGAVHTDTLKVVISEKRGVILTGENE